MPLVHECAHEGCGLLTMSVYCLEHEQAAEHFGRLVLRDPDGETAHGIVTVEAVLVENA